MDMDVNTIVSKFSCDTQNALNSPNWVNIDLATLLKLLSADSLSITSELDLLNAIQRWANKACLDKGIATTTESIRDVCPGAIEQIRFLTLTPLQFAESLTNSPLLTQDEITALAINIAYPFHVGDMHHPVPPGFSTSLRPRNSWGNMPELLRAKMNAGTIYSAFRAIGNLWPHLVEPKDQCGVLFDVDVDIVLTGIALMPRLPNAAASHYMERVKLTFSSGSFEHQKIEMTFDYSTVVNSGQYVFINLPKPLYVKKRSNISVLVQMLDSGFYPAIGDICPYSVVQLRGNAKAHFQFQQCSSWFLLRALFFSA